MEYTELLRILHLSTYDTTGGAARAAYRLHRGLLRFGHDSSMLVAQRRSNDPTVVAIAPKMDLGSRIRRRLRQQQIRRSFSRYLAQSAGSEKFSDDRSVYGSDLLDGLLPCDAINLHWISGLVDYQSFFSAVPRHVPMFWRLADMNALTGGCHFDNGCGRYSTGCGACPQLGSRDSRDLSREIWLRKDAAFRSLEPERLHIIALNRWMADIVRQNPLLGKFPVTVIPNGVDTEVFAPRDTRFARSVLGIPQEARVVMFAAEHLSNRRKGFPLLAQALSQLSASSDLFLLSAGGSHGKIEAPIPHRHVGFVDNDRLLSLVYSAADLYVIPSLQDNQPNTVLEAMACGVPVVGFEVGGIPDMVRPGITGTLTPAGDVACLSAAILDLIRGTDQRGAMAVDCRRIVMNEYRLETQIQRYIELYETSFRKDYEHHPEELRTLAHHRV